MIKRILKNKESSFDPQEMIVSQPPGEIFRLAKGVKITAVDMAIIALPKALFQYNESLSSVVDADDEIRVAIPQNSDKIFLYVDPGKSLTLKKSSEVYIVANDGKPCRVRVTKPDL